MLKLVFFLYFLLFGFLQLIANAEDLNVKKSLWNGFERHDFQFNGVKSILVVPHSPVKNLPWVWRARFFGNHVAVERWNQFYKMLTNKKGLSKKPTLEGMSRGGLIIYTTGHPKTPTRFHVFMGMHQCAIFEAGQAEKETARVGDPFGTQC